jgi:hypothetical protein
MAAGVDAGVHTRTRERAGLAAPIAVLATIPVRTTLPNGVVSGARAILEAHEATPRTRDVAGIVVVRRAVRGPGWHGRQSFD